MLDAKIFGTLSAAQTAVLKKSDIKELVNLFDICQAARDAAFGLVNQPRCKEKTLLVIDTFITNHIDLLTDATIRELEGRKPKSVDELEWRNQCLCEWEMACGSFTDAAKLLVDLVSNEKNLPERIE